MTCAELLNPSYNGPQDQKFTNGEEDPKGKYSQDLGGMKLFLVGLQHMCAVLFSVCVPVIIIIGAGMCKCTNKAETTEVCTAGMTNDNIISDYVLNSSGGVDGFCFVKTDADANYLISMAIFMSGFSTMMQCSKLGPVGSNLLAIMGTSFAFIDVMIETGFFGGPDKGIGLILGMSLATAWFEPFIIYVLPKPIIKKLQHPTILGSVVMIIGFELTASAMSDWAGKPWNGGGARLHMYLGLTSVIILTCLTRFGSNVVRNVSVLITIFVGYMIAGILNSSIDEYEGRINGVAPCHINATYTGLLGAALKDSYSQPAGKGAFGYLAACAPILDLTPMETADWITYPFKQTYGFYFEGSLFGAWLIAVLASTLESMGDITATAKLSGKKVQGRPFAHRLRGGLNGDAVGSFLSALVGAFPNTTYSENNGLISMTGMHDYRAGWIAGGLMMCFGLFSKFGGFVRSVPGPVMGGVLTVLFTQVGVSGVRMVAEPSQEDVDNFKKGKLKQLVMPLANPRNQFILACSLGLGLGTATNHWDLNHTTLGYASSIHKSVASQSIVSNGISIGALTAIILNFLIPENNPRTFVQDLKYIFTCGCVTECVKEMKEGDDEEEGKVGGDPEEGEEMVKQGDDKPEIAHAQA